MPLSLFIRSASSHGIFPLALALGRIPGEGRPDCVFIAVGGTKASVPVFVVEGLSDKPQHELQATLSGHEGWIRSLSLLHRQDEFFLASASHDKYVRIWRIGKQRSKPGPDTVEPQGELEKTFGAQSANPSRWKFCMHQLSSKPCFWAMMIGFIQRLGILLVTHSNCSLPQPMDHSQFGNQIQLTGIWISRSRLGQISGQKGATTATGSAGGFWVGLWSRDGQAIMCLDRSGSWRHWQHDPSSDYWTSKPGVSGSYRLCDRYLLVKGWPLSSVDGIRSDYSIAR